MPTTRLADESSEAVTQRATSQDARCTPTTVTLGDQWTPVEIDVKVSCPAYSTVKGFTITRLSGRIDLMVAEIPFQ